MSGFVFNFRKRFAPAVETGRKRQTIRGNRKDKRVPKIGDTAYCWTGLRTRGARRLATGTIDKVSRAQIRQPSSLFAGQILVDGRELKGDEAELFAKADGFATAHELVMWFRDTYEIEVFEGFCVEWHPIANAKAAA